MHRCDEQPQSGSGLRQTQESSLSPSVLFNKPIQTRKLKGVAVISLSNRAYLLLTFVTLKTQ